MKTQNKYSISVVVPVLNEQGNIIPLVKRIDTVLKGIADYEIIFVDDHSSDNSVKEIEEIQKNYPIKYFLEKVLWGKHNHCLKDFLMQLMN